MGELGAPYVDLEELKLYLKLPSTTRDITLTGVANSASQEINRYCRRQFNKADEASARRFKPVTNKLCMVDDIYDDTSVVVATDTTGSATFDTAWASTAYELSPANGVVDGVPGFPYYRVTAGAGLRFPTWTQREYTVEVTAKWGWAEVPAPIVEACMLMAAQMYKLTDAPFGVAGFGDFGVVRVRDLPQVEKKLMKYRRDAVLVG